MDNRSEVDSSYCLADNLGLAVEASSDPEEEVLLPYNLLDMVLEDMVRNLDSKDPLALDKVNLLLYLVGKLGFVGLGTIDILVGVWIES